MAKKAVTKAGKRGTDKTVKMETSGTGSDPERKIKFTKMSGAGNDFIVIDNRKQQLVLTASQIETICNRYLGVGADGLLLVEEGGKGADFTMVYYNADGSLAEMCGNGARCFAQFVRTIKKETAERVSFHTGAGIVEARFVGTDVAINLTAPHSLSLHLRVPTSSGEWMAHSINTGVPHLVCFVNDVNSIDVQKLGSEMRYHPMFAPKGTNVNFVQATGPDSVIVRTYERGVEAETLACGTGVVASSILAHVVSGLGKPLKVSVKSGVEMTVDFDGNGETFSAPTLQGPASIIFTGEISLPR